MGFGHADRILRVDLSTRRTWTEPLPPQNVLRQYVGGTGLAMWYLATMTPKSAMAGDPDVPLIFMTGPLAGTSAPSSSNYVVLSLHYDIPYAPGAGHSHGFWAARLKHAGYEGIVITGASDEPVYLWIDDDHVEIRDAAKVWGRGTRDTEALIQRELGGEASTISVACIGQAGEACLHGATVRNDRNHGAGKGSPGATMGSKKLKAIAVRGTGQVGFADKPTFLDTTLQWEKNLFLTQEGKNPSLAVLWKDAGMTRKHGFMSQMGITAVKNLTDYEFGMKFSKKYMDACKEWTVTPTPSFNCQIACSYNLKITTGEFAGYTVSMCGGGEPFEGAAGMVGVDDPGRMMVMTDYYDDIGMESGHGGAVLGMLWEAYNRGFITKEDTGGLELTWGNYDAFMEIWQQILEGRDFGGKLVGDMKDVARDLKLEHLLVHVRGAGINIHDWRANWGVLLGQIVAGTGPSHFYSSADAEQRFLTESPRAVGRNPELMPEAQATKIWQDSLGVCWFACMAVKDIGPLTVKCVASATGWTDFTEEEALLSGERSVNLMRLLAVSRGLTRESDLDVGQRLLEAPTGGPAAGHALGPHLDEMVSRYYAAAGWDQAGRPTSETIRRLGLEDVAEHLGVLD